KLTQDFLGLGGIDVHAAASAGKAPVEAAAGTILKARLRPGESEAIVLGALLLVSHDIVRILDFLEFLLSLLVARRAVVMLVAGPVAVRLVDRVSGGIVAHAQQFVGIALHDFVVGPKSLAIRHEFSSL